MINVTFDTNSATSEGPAISNLGSLESMSLVSFVGNNFFCDAGEFLEHIDVGVSVKTPMDFRHRIQADFPGSVCVVAVVAFAQLSQIQRLADQHSTPRPVRKRKNLCSVEGYKRMNPIDAMSMPAGRVPDANCSVRWNFQADLCQIVI